MRGAHDDRDYHPISLNWFKKKKKNTNVNNDLKQKNIKRKMLPSKIYSDNDTKKKKSHKVKKKPIKNTILESTSRSIKIREWMQ